MGVCASSPEAALSVEQLNRGRNACSVTAFKLAQVDDVRVCVSSKWCALSCVVYSLAPLTVVTCIAYRLRSLRIAHSLFPPLPCSLARAIFLSLSLSPSPSLSLSPRLALIVSGTDHSAAASASAVGAGAQARALHRGASAVSSRVPQHSREADGTALPVLHAARPPCAAPRCLRARRRQ